MRKQIILLLAALLCASLVYSQQITGSWSGTLDILGNELPIVFHIEKKDSLYSTKMDSPAQNAFDLPTDKTTFVNDTLTLEAKGLGLNYRGKLQGDSLTGTFTQGGLSIPLTLRQTDEPALNRPQTPQPPFPYKTEEITFHNKAAGIELAGTLTLPDSAGTFPAVVLVAGSGPNDRDETILGHKPFLVIADHLTRNGFIVLRYDKRGVGSSGGKDKIATVTTKDYAKDASAAVDYLMTRPETNKSAIGMIGHSEGGVIAPMVAAENKNVDYIVLLAGTGVPGIEISLKQNEIGMKAQNTEPEDREKMLKITREVFESLAGWEGSEADKTALRDKINYMWDHTPLLLRMKMNKEQFIRSNFNSLSSPWIRQFFTLDPQDYLQRVKCPVLVLNGEKDMQVTPEMNLPAIKRGLEKGGNYRYEIKLYPGINHLFQECETGLSDEYVKIEQTLSPQVLSDITNWIKRQKNKED